MTSARKFRLRMTTRDTIYNEFSANRLDLLSNELEAICIEITKPRSKPYVIFACYRPPDSDADSFCDSYEAI